MLITIGTVTRRACRGTGGTGAQRNGRHGGQTQGHISCECYGARLLTWSDFTSWLNKLLLNVLQQTSSQLIRCREKCDCLALPNLIILMDFVFIILYVSLFLPRVRNILMRDFLIFLTCFQLSTVHFFSTLFAGLEAVTVVVKWKPDTEEEVGSQLRFILGWTKKFTASFRRWRCSMRRVTFYSPTPHDREIAARVSRT